MSAVVIHDNPALLAEAIDAKSRQEQMQDAGVVGILDVLGVELPIVRQYLGAAAQNPSRPVQHATDSAGDFRPELGFELGPVVAERPENQSGKLRHPQPLAVVV